VDRNTCIRTRRKLSKPHLEADKLSVCVFIKYLSLIPATYLLTRNSFLIYFLIAHNKFEPYLNMQTISI